MPAMTVKLYYHRNSIDEIYIYIYIYIYILTYLLHGAESF